ncbi:metallophosphoesterase [Aggregatilinea lenta]|uniref:metallophosphoesterase n=1 Tax=Aggregatilinea lenta TaxID=913108 RepID=UPI000E5B69E8|nr:metallophosphoesterase family protein [Aggregatilinea lenta]
MPDRFLNLTDGVAFIVSDLHGDRDAFDRCLDHFYRLHRRGEVQYLILLGDLIHRSGPAEQDASLSMALDVLALYDELGPAVVMLLGNHEMPHIYGVTLSKGDQDYTPRFEHALGAYRTAVVGLFERLPFLVRTGAGVMLSHAGPSMDVIALADPLRTYNHCAVLAEADQMLAELAPIEEAYRMFGTHHGAPYERLAQHILAVSGPADPRFSHLLRGFIVGQRSRTFNMLWDLLFTRNEYGLNATAYLNGCQRFLEAFGTDAPAPQRVMVSGHIGTRGGHSIINAHHLRLSSAAHAHPREAGEYLLLDCARPVESADALLAGLRPVF